jgi:hypothetical protein
MTRRSPFVLQVGSSLAPPLHRVERSLYQRANGYNFEAVKIFMPAGSKQPVVVHYIEHCPPDPTSAMFWLKNRVPDNWRDVQNVDHVLGKYIISDRPMTEEQWAKELDSHRSRSVSLRRQRPLSQGWLDDAK